MQLFSADATMFFKKIIIFGFKSIAGYNGTHMVSYLYNHLVAMQSIGHFRAKIKILIIDYKDYLAGDGTSLQ